VLLAAALLTLAGCGAGTTSDARDPHLVVPSSASSSGPSPGVRTATSAASAESLPTTDGGDPPRPVYYVGSTPGGPRLFRYFEPNDTGEPDDGTGRIVGLLMATPSDPDYRTLWSMSSLEGVWVEGGTASVTLRDESVRERPPSMTAQEAELAVQQVVYTVQAAAQQRVSVKFLLDGEPVEQVLGVPAREPFTAAAQLDVLALVSITNPAEGQEVEGSFTADGVASSFEGSVPWELRSPTGEVVLRGTGQASMGDHLTPWTTGPIDVSRLEPGTYTFTAATDDPTGGEGPGPTEDTRTVIVG
jgi:hypothetical protein